MARREVELVWPGRAELGEGPVWHDAALWWVDIPRGQLNRFDPTGGRSETVYVCDQPIGSAVPCDDGRWLLARGDGFVRLDPRSGVTEPLADPEGDRPDNRFNDGKCDPFGRFWAGTMGPEGRGVHGSLYVLERDGCCRRVLSGVAVSNGLAWSSDGTRLFYNDTPTATVQVFDFDAPTGELSGRRVLARFEPGGGLPDGMTIDAEDNLWVALWDGGQVVRLDGRSGDVLERIAVPAPRTTSCCFGGESLDELYITTARVGLGEDMLSRYPDSGGLFRARPGVAGRACDRYTFSRA